MIAKRAWPLVGLAAFVSVGLFVWINYDSMPWVGTHFSLAHPDEARWDVSLKLQQGRALGGADARLTEVPEPNRSASLSAILLEQPSRSGGEWLSSLRIESISSIQFSWEQKQNKDVLNSRWSARIGPTGGLRNLELQPASRSVWLRSDLLTPWVGCLWPEFPKRGMEPGQGWSSQVPFRMSATELSEPIAGQWNCNWRFRGINPQGAVSLATLDLQAQAVGAEATVQGVLQAEVLYALEARQVYGVRGAYSLKYAAKTQATEQSAVALLEGSTMQFQVVRKIAAPAAETATLEK